MKIVGCDLHTRYQQIAILDTETGELIERRLEHAKGEARAFYAELQGPVRVGIEATGRLPQVRPAFGLTWVPSRDGISKPTVSTVGTQRQIPLHSAEALKRMWPAYPRFWDMWGFRLSSPGWVSPSLESSPRRFIRYPRSTSPSHPPVTCVLFFYSPAL